MQLARQALPLLQRRHSPRRLVEPSILDRQTSPVRQCLHESLFLIGKLVWAGE